MKTQKVRTSQDVRSEFSRKGVSVSNWAASNGFPSASVYQVLSGRNAASVGVGHKIAVLLGIKEGEIVEESSHE
jgi:gp16 family phage-associated protein